MSTSRQPPPPHRRPFSRILLVGIALLTAPWPFIGGQVSYLLGIPLWLWWSGAMTCLLSVATAWTVLEHWEDSDSE